MAVPKYDELMKPLLVAVQDGEVYKMKDVTSMLAQQLNLSAEDLVSCFRAAGKLCSRTGLAGQRPI